MTLVGFLGWCFLNNNKAEYICIDFLAGVIKDHSSLEVGVKIGRVISPRVIGISKVAGVNNSGEAIGKDTVIRARRTAKRDTVNRDTAMVIGTAAGISSITTTSIGASNHRVVRPLRLAAKL